MPLQLFFYSKHPYTRISFNLLGQGRLMFDRNVTMRFQWTLNFVFLKWKSKCNVLITYHKQKPSLSRHNSVFKAIKLYKFWKLQFFFVFQNIPPVTGVWRYIPVQPRMKYVEEILSFIFIQYISFYFFQLSQIYKIYSLSALVSAIVCIKPNNRWLIYGRQECDVTLLSVHSNKKFLRRCLDLDQVRLTDFRDLYYNG